MDVLRRRFIVMCLKDLYRLAFSQYLKGDLYDSIS